MKNLLLAALIAHSFTLSSQGHWQLVQQHPITFYGVYGLDDQNLWLSSGSGEYFRSTDGGVQLQMFKIPDSYSFLNDIAIWNDSTMLIGGGCYFPFDQCPGNIVLNTDTSGANWNIRMLDTFQFSTGVVQNFDLHPDGQVYAVSDYGGIYHSPDLGENWTSIPVLPPYSINVYSAVQFTDQQTGYVMGTKYIQPNEHVFRLFKTVDGGQEWTMKLEYLSNDITHQRMFWFVDALTGFVPGDAGTLHKTTDGGETWTEQQATAAEENIQRVQFADSQTGYLFTYNGGLYRSKIYRSTDGGQNWTLDLQTDTTFFSDIHFYDANSGYAVTLEGKIYARTAGNPTYENAQQRPIVVFPNPAENTFQVNFEVGSGENAYFVLYDIQGRVVLEQTLTQNKETIHCNGLQAGPYIYALTQQQNGWVGRGKIILR